MKTWGHNPWTILALRLIVGGLFVYAGILKMLDPQAFADSIHTFQMLPSPLINIVALSLPPFEIVTGAMLIFGFQQRLAAFALGALTFVFLIALGQALVRGLEVDCGCFGAGEPSLTQTWVTVFRDLVLICSIGWMYSAFSSEPESAL